VVRKRLGITIEDMIREVEMEIALRLRVYPKWVRDKKLPQVLADRRVEVMEAALARLKAAPTE
jgi:hypothetical protein